jgi:hypothetical protein
VTDVTTWSFCFYIAVRCRGSEDGYDVGQGMTGVYGDGLTASFIDNIVVVGSVHDEWC